MVAKKVIEQANLQAEEQKIEIERLKTLNEDLQGQLEELIKSSGNGKHNKDEALLKLVNILYDTPDEKLAQLTKIPQRAVLPLSIMITQLAAQDANRDIIKSPLPQIWMNAYFKLQRSVDKWFFLHGVGIAHEQVAIQAEQAAEEHELGAITGER